VSDRHILVIVPTYNERDNLPRKIPLILDQDPRIDVLVVDDASPDGTGELADELAAEDPRVHVLHRPGKEGLGKAYLAGFRWGLDRGYDLLFEMDADISHPPEALPRLITAAQTHDVVIGSRYVGGRVNVLNWPLFRLLVSGVDLDRVRSNGYAFQIELKFRAWVKGFSLVEVPILFTERDSGESKMSKRIVREAVWRVWWLKIRQLAGRL